MRDFGAEVELEKSDAFAIRTLDDASAILDRLGQSDDPLVEFAREEIFCCTCGLSSLERVRTAVRIALGTEG